MSERRHSLKINQSFQDRFLLEIVVMIFIVFNLLLALVLTLDAGDIGVYLALVVGMGEFGALGFFYWYLLRSSNRIAGPVFSLRTRFHAVQQGDLTTSLKFRKKDYFHDTSESFNDCVADLRIRVITLRRMARAMQENTTEGTKLSEMADQLVIELSHFKTE
jgi:methyl-accepting chemotaxis protein